MVVCLSQPRSHGSLPPALLSRSVGRVRENPGNEVVFIVPLTSTPVDLETPQVAQAQCVSLMINTYSFILRDLKWP